MTDIREIGRNISITIRSKCEVCNGKGRLKRRPGQSYRTMSDGRRGPRCPYCMGEGHVETRLAPNPPRPIDQDGKR
jgi:DnaJ-class molecular chaperone